MAFKAITALVVVVLAYACRRLAELYGLRAIVKLASVTLVFFFVKELLQAHRLLVHHFYSVNHAIWFSLFGVPPFVVFGHLFVVVMTWQLAVLTMHRLKLAAHPAVFVTLVWCFTAAFAMLMENTGIVGGWWVWKMPSWQWFPMFLGAPLRDLPLERPISEVWGYFISTFWCVLLLVDLPRRWTPRSVALLVAGLALALVASRSTSTSNWSWIERYLPFVSVLWPVAWDRPGRKLLFPTDSVLLREPGRRQKEALFAGLLAMCLVSIVQVGVKSKWPDLVALLPIVAFGAGAVRKWPLWVDGAVAMAALLLGYTVHSGNLMLAAWLVLRVPLVLVPLLLLSKWREGASARGAAAGAVASASTGSPAPAALRS